MKFLVMDRSGHSEQVFDRANVLSLAEAERRFAYLTGSLGFAASVRTGPGTSRLVRSFDPTAEETLFVPHLCGG